MKKGTSSLKMTVLPNMHLGIFSLATVSLIFEQQKIALTPHVSNEETRQIVTEAKG